MSKILIVEDDNNLREIYGARLEAEGYQIVSASDGEEALALAIREQPDLIISDVMMPKISGFDMLDILRSTPETKDVKVIVMTALSQDEDRRRGEQLGADKYIVKSQVTLDDVVEMVREIIDSQPVAANPPTPNEGYPQPSTQETPAIDLTASDSDEVKAVVEPIDQNVPLPDTKELEREVEEFVATSPLMNGTAPTQQAPTGQESLPPIQSIPAIQADQNSDENQMPTAQQTPLEPGAALGQTPNPQQNISSTTETQAQIDGAAETQ